MTKMKLGGPLTRTVSGLQKSPTSASSKRRTRTHSIRRVRPKATTEGDADREARRMMTWKRALWSLSLQLSRFLSHQPSSESSCGAESPAREMVHDPKVNLSTMPLLIPHLDKPRPSILPTTPRSAMCHRPLHLMTLCRDLRDKTCAKLTMTSFTKSDYALNYLLF